jgi:CHASE2 domain-containing sensor protein
MNKLVVIEIGAGSFEQGFPVSLDIRGQGRNSIIQAVGHLPSALEVIQSYQNWQQAYQALDITPRSDFLKIPSAQITNVSITELAERCQNWFQSLQTNLTNWYSTQSFSPIRETLKERVRLDEEIRIVISTSDPNLWQIPWTIFFSEFLNSHHRAEVALSASAFERIDKVPQSRQKVRILAILGNSDWIDLEPDCQSLQHILGDQAEIVFLPEPKRQEINDKLWEEGWDILFFAGHSSSQDNIGQIYINQTESITIEDLKYGLKKAIHHGLQLAIFNSCDGLSLAKDLIQLHIPQAIVMREIVPDKIAQRFLQYFLELFVVSTPLYIAVRTARERLHVLDRQFPYSSWMPVICQNPAEEPITWKNLCPQTQLSYQKIEQIEQKLEPQGRSLKVLFFSVAIASILTTGLLMGLWRSVLLLHMEVKAFNAMTRLKPDEGVEPNLLVVGITKDDLTAIGEDPPSDRTLAKLFTKLETYKPSVIGLDIFRDRDVPPLDATLAKHFQKKEFVGACSIDAEGKGISPPKNVTTDRVGSIDSLEDQIDNIVRRQLLAKDIDFSRCQTGIYFGYLIATKYLKWKSIQKPEIKIKTPIRFGKAVINPIIEDGGGYQSFEDMEGYQIFINWRSPKSINQIDLTQALEGAFDPSLAQNKIILIGYDIKSKGDYVSTPYSEGQPPEQDMPGVMVHAQMASQIISAVRDGRPLIQVWSIWGDGLWIWTWALAGGATALVWHRRRIAIALSCAGVVALPPICFGLFCIGWWVPIVPAVAAFVATEASVIIWIWRSKKQK